MQRHGAKERLVDDNDVLMIAAVNAFMNENGSEGRGMITEDVGDVSMEDGTGGPWEDVTMRDPGSDDGEDCMDVYIEKKGRKNEEEEEEEDNEDESDEESNSQTDED